VIYVVLIVAVVCNVAAALVLMSAARAIPRAIRTALGDPVGRARSSACDTCELLTKLGYDPGDVLRAAREEHPVFPRGRYDETLDEKVPQ